MGALSRLFRVNGDTKVGVDMEDVLEAYTETKDVLMFEDYPKNMFGTMNIKSFLKSMNYEADIVFA